MDLVRHFRAMARNNLWSNHRLHRACAGLAPEAFLAERTGFFPTLSATLNHILIVDWYYLDALEAGGRGQAVFENEVPFPDAPGLAKAQEEADRRLIAFCDRLEAGGLAAEVRLDRGEQVVKRETAAAVLAHLFVHQIHHRGQAHAMLSGTSINPPQLDEYFLEQDRSLRCGELELLGIA